MARPTNTRPPGGGGLALQTGTSPGLRVVAPLNVSVGPSQAEILAESLGVAFKAAEPHVQQRIAKDAAEATALGRNAAALNQIDAKRQAEDESYAIGVKRGMVDRGIVDFKSMARTFYEEQFDKSQGTEALAQELDNIARGALGNYARDPEAARWIAPEVQSEVARLTGAHDQELAAQFKEDRIASSSALIRDALAEGRAVDPEEIMTRLRPVLGNREATKAYVGMVGSLAVENRSPEMIEALIPEKWADGTPGPRSIPELNQQLNQSRYYAEAASRERESELAEAAEQDATAVKFRGLVDALSGVDPSIGLLTAAANGLPIKPSDVTTLTNFYRSSRDDIREQRLDPVRLAEFRARMIDDPQSVGTDDVIAFVAGNHAPGKDGVTQANILFDDYVSAKNAANVIRTNPVAKADRAYFAGRFKPEVFASEAEKERYFHGMRTFDKTLLDTGDAEKAREAAEDWFSKRPTDVVKATGNIASDAKAFTDGKLSLQSLRATYPREDFAEDIYRRALRGEISREAAEKIIRAIHEQQ